jgi:hypothetical protein
LGSRLKDALIWVGAGVIVASLLATARLGGRFASWRGVGFFPLAILAFALVVVCWEILSEDLKRTNVPRWRRLISVCGCAVLSAAFISPFFGVSQIFEGMSWTYWSFGLSLLASLCGILAPMPLRFGLFFGGLTMAGVILTVPLGVL